jgi:hypothetical protein
MAVFSEELVGSAGFKPQAAQPFTMLLAAPLPHVE